MVYPGEDHSCSACARLRGVFAAVFGALALSGGVLVSPAIATGQPTSPRPCKPAAFTGRVRPRPPLCEGYARLAPRESGPQGKAGARGPTGLAGLPGPTGPEGLHGLLGATGPSGQAGATGSSGTNGAPGLVGPTGGTGLAGLNGAPGATGFQGLPGPAGATGATGPIGASGAAGAGGATGATGLTGAAGGTGPAGPKGEIGTPGAVGAPGPAGGAGPTGPAGPKGEAGTPGAAGSAGSTGPTGAQGEPGTPGAAGSAGPTGPAGPEGSSHSSAYAEFYALMPPDNAVPVGVGVPVQFPENGPSSGVITRHSGSATSEATEFVLPNIGTYSLSFSVSVTEAGQLVVALNSGAGMVELPYTAYGRAVGMSEITGDALVTTTTADSTVELRNPAGNAEALTITSRAGGAMPAVASLAIQQLD